MSLKKRKLILDDDIPSIEACIALFNVLENFKLPSAEDVNSTLKYTLEEDFCHDCEAHRDYCECREMGGRYMPEYDDGADYED